MSQVIAALERDHANITKLLDILESEILAIKVGKTPAYPLMRDIMRYMTGHSDRFHHPKEDLIFAQLLKRDPGVRADVEDLLEEHVSIGLAGQKFNSLLCASAVDSVDVREQLGTAGYAYIHALREHMQKEEGKLFTLAKAVLTEKDWQVINEQVNSIIINDPFYDVMFGDDYQRLYRLLIEQTKLDAGSGHID